MWYIMPVRGCKRSCSALNSIKRSFQQTAAVSSNTWQPAPPSLRSRFPLLCRYFSFCSVCLTTSPPLPHTNTHMCSVALVKSCFIDLLSGGAWDRVSIFSLIPTVWTMYDGLLLNPQSCQSQFTEKTKDAPWWLYNTQCSNFSFVLFYPLLVISMKLF